MYFSRYWGSSTTRLTSAAMRSITGRGVPAGAAMANHDRASNGIPASAKVGTSGTSADRCGWAIASAFILPLRMCGRDGPMADSAMSICPARSAGTTSLVPLYGTCVSFIPATDANASASRCVTLPGPMLP